MSVIVYVTMAGGLAEESLNAVAVLMGGSTFHTAMRIMLTLAVGSVSYQYIVGRKISIFSKWFVMYFIITVMLLGIKMTVHVVDIQNDMKVHTVDDVPLGLAVPASLISNIGRSISQAFDDVFHMTNDQGYNKTGMIFGSRVMLASSSANFAASPDLSTDLSSYMRQCVWIPKVQISKTLSASDLMHSNDLQSLLFSNPSNIFSVMILEGDKGNMSCKDAASYLKSKLANASDIEMQQFANSFTDGDRTKFKTELNNASGFFIPSSQTGANLMLQNMLINKVRGSVSDAMAFEGNEAGLMNYANTSSMNNLRIAEANSFWMAGYRLPMLNACLWILVMCFFPLVILLSMLPFFSQAYVGFIKTMLWIWLWPPLFTVLHFCVSFYSESKIDLFGHVDKGITLSNINPINMVHSDMAFTVGFLAMFVPFIAKGLTTGIADSFVSMSQALSSTVQGTSQAASASASTGNISLANISGWNMNHDNTSANKHDTNFTDYHGMSSQQAANGAIITETGAGRSIINTSSALSQMAVGVQGSQSLVSSLTQNAQMSQHRGDSLRSSSDRSLQESMKEGSTFSNSDTRDYKAGAGLSITDQYGINRDYRHMQDAVNQWNSSHDASHQVSLQESMRASFDSQRQVFGKVASWASGVSFSANATGSHNRDDSARVSEFLNSSDGQSFSKSFSHALTSAKNMHVDGSGSEHLSHAEQSAVDFNRSMSLSHQASAEYSKSENYSQAANIAESQSQSINSNMSSAFVNWAEANKGESALSVLSGTDAQDIKTASTWGNEFLSSSEGKSVVDAQAQNLMQQVQSSSSKSSYDQASAGVLNQDQANQLQSSYQAGKDHLQQQSQDAHLGLTKPQSELAAKQFAQSQRSDLMKQSNVIQSQSGNHMSDGEGSVTKDAGQNKKSVEGELSHGVIINSVKDLVDAI